MLFFRMNYFDRQDYNNIRKTAAATLVMIAFSCHLDLHDGLEELAFTGKKDTEVRRISLGRSLSV